jgi:hypothetical protein
VNEEDLDSYQDIDAEPVITETKDTKTRSGSTNYVGISHSGIFDELINANLMALAKDRATSFN